jgi:hypothetical protein
MFKITPMKIGNTYDFRIKSIMCRMVDFMHKNKNWDKNYGENFKNDHTFLILVSSPKRARYISLTFNSFRNKKSVPSFASYFLDKDKLNWNIPCTFISMTRGKVQCKFTFLLLLYKKLILQLFVLSDTLACNGTFWPLQVK